MLFPPLPDPGADVGEIEYVQAVGVAVNVAVTCAVPEIVNVVAVWLCDEKEPPDPLQPLNW